MRNNQASMPLRVQAMEALQESTTMLQVASNLLEQGNRVEAERLHKAARRKRNVSVLLMAEANALENDLRYNDPEVLSPLRRHRSFDNESVAAFHAYDH